MINFILPFLFVVQISFIVSAQDFELRPHLLYSFHNVGYVQAGGIRLEGIVTLKKQHLLYTNFELLYGEGNKNFKEIAPGRYNYDFTQKSVPDLLSAYSVLYPKNLNVTSARMLQMAFKTGYRYRLSLGKSDIELGLGLYGNYASGMYVVDVIKDYPNVNPLEPYDYFVVHYLYHYIDWGPQFTIQYLLPSKNKKTAPIIGFEYNYGTQNGSWASINIGLRFL